MVDRVTQKESFKIMEEMGIVTDSIQKCVGQTFVDKSDRESENVVLRDAA